MFDLLFLVDCVCVCVSVVRALLYFLFFAVKWCSAHPSHGCVG